MSEKMNFLIEAKGVNKSFAIQAGRELRIIVDPVSIDDKTTAFVASDIAEKIEADRHHDPA